MHLAGILRLRFTPLAVVLSVGRYVHFGGDEVITACWAEDPDIQAWVSRTRRTYRELFVAFQHRVMSIIFDLGRTPLAWQDALDVGGEDGLTDFAHPNGKLAVQPWKCWDRLAVRAAVTSISGKLQCKSNFMSDPCFC
jgi:hypothetical protein